jgi:hypothetical protein
MFIVHNIFNSFDECIKTKFTHTRLNDDVFEGHWP